MADDTTRDTPTTDEVLLNAPAPDTTYGKEIGITDGTFYTSDESGLVEVWPRHVVHLLTQGFTLVGPVDADEPLPEGSDLEERPATESTDLEESPTIPSFTPVTGEPLAESTDTTGGSPTGA